MRNAAVLLNFAENDDRNLVHAGTPPADVATAVRAFVDAFLALAGKD